MDLSGNQAALSNDKHPCTTIILAEFCDPKLFACDCAGHFCKSVCRPFIQAIGAVSFENRFLTARSDCAMRLSFQPQPQERCGNSYRRNYLPPVLPHKLPHPIRRARRGGNDGFAGHMSPHIGREGVGRLVAPGAVLIQAFITIQSSSPRTNKPSFSVRCGAAARDYPASDDAGHQSRARKEAVGALREGL